MTIEIRNPGADELRSAMEATHVVFADPLSDDHYERQRKMLSLDRFYAAYDDGVPVGTAADYEFRLTVPGGELGAGGVTWVGVLPSHRRRGILTQLMRRELDDIHERGEPLAVLWASEAAIYGRFGYGVAAPTTQLAGERARFGLRDAPAASGRVRIVSLDDALEPCMHVYETVRPNVPGFVARSAEWWKSGRLADPEEWRRGASPKYAAIVELDGAPAAYVLYRIKQSWQHGFSQSEVRLVETLAVGPVAERELWRFVFGIDLIERVEGRVDPASPLFLMVNDARSLHLRISEGLWLRTRLRILKSSSKAPVDEETVVAAVSGV